MHRLFAIYRKHTKNRLGTLTSPRCLVKAVPVTTMMTKPQKLKIPLAAQEAHSIAVREKRDMYIDPATGYNVFTEYSHRMRGTCCGNACRHCPFAHAAVPSKYKANRPTPRISTPTFIPGNPATFKTIRRATRDRRRANASLKEAAQRDVDSQPQLSPGTKPVEYQSEVNADCLFWSGGKESYLALKAVQLRTAEDNTQHLEDDDKATEPVEHSSSTNGPAYSRGGYTHVCVAQEQSVGVEGSGVCVQARGVNGRTVLVTTINAATWEASHQCVSVERIIEQARYLKLDLLLIPLDDWASNDDYRDGVLDGLKEMNNSGLRAKRLIFGDLGLEEVRDWRISVFGKDMDCVFPIYGVDKHLLLQDLWDAEDMSVRVVSLPQGTFGGALGIGGIYDLSSLERLPSTVDVMGENGEFQTEVVFATPRETKGSDW